MLKNERRASLCHLDVVSLQIHALDVMCHPIITLIPSRRFFQQHQNAFHVYNNTDSKWAPWP